MNETAAIVGQEIPAHHDLRLVVLSVVISLLAAYAARDLAGRLDEARGRAWLIWFAGAAIVDGIGTWSMHYTGKLGLRLPVPLQLDWRVVLLSLVVAVIGSGAALLVMCRYKPGWRRALAAGVLLGGVGVSGLHFIAMAAMRVPDMHRYSSPLIILSVALGIGFALWSLTASFLLRQDTPRRRHAGAILRGLANPVMHYTAMAGTVFVFSGQPPDLSHAVSISSLGVLGISIVPIVVLVVALLTSVVDRLQKHRALLDELFEQAPQAVALMSADRRIVRVNREFTRLFGYAAQETAGRRIDELITPDDARDEEQDYAARVAQGQRLDAESVRRRKDGSRFHVSITRVPVSLPGGKVEIYAIYRDITERKLAEEALRESEKNLRELLEERQRLSRDLHDHIVQAIYAIGMRLERIQRKCTPDVSADIRQMIDALNQVIRDARRYIAGAQPDILSESQFRAELARMIHTAERGGALRFEIEVDAAAFEALSTIEMEHVLHIAREALSNAIRHSQANRGTIRLQALDDAVRLEIHDDGIGFDPSSPEHKGSGLHNMFTRTRQIDAKLQILSTVQGTRIIVDIPKPGLRAPSTPAP